MSMPTCYDKLSNNDVVLPGLNRVYAIGQTAYRYVHRENAAFAKLVPVCWIEHTWVPVQGTPLIKEWTDYCTLLNN